MTLTPSACAAQQIVDAIMSDDDDGWGEYALRTIPGARDAVVSVGDVLAPSNVWDDGNDTGESLDGTSAIRITGYDHAGVMAALQMLGADGDRINYFGDTVVLIKSPDFSRGEDLNEIVLRDPIVINIWKKKAKGKGALIPLDG